MKQKVMRLLLPVIVITCMLLSQVALAENTASGSSDKDIEYLKSVMDMIKTKYNGEITEKQLLEGALKGMFGTMDPYTQYFTNEEAESFYGGLSGSYYGIGIVMQQGEEYVEVQKVFSGSPAEKAGIYPGDKIYSVNGKKVSGKATEEISSLIKKSEEKKVTIGIIRGTGSKVMNISVEVAEFTIDPVTYEINNNIGYIKLDYFSSNAADTLIKALGEMDKNNVSKLIIDLRDNPGGYVELAVAIARKFVPKGLITKLDFKSESTGDIEYNSYLEKTKYKIAVLVNGNSASASEILAGAIQDTKAGVLIGTKTFGKAKVQSLVPILTPEAFKKYEQQLGVKLVDASELSSYNVTPSDDDIIGYSKMTTGVYTTPNGRMIDQKGLLPDIEISDPVDPKNVEVSSIKKLRMVVKPALNDSGPDVFYAERILKLLGYNVGEADSKLDKKTFDAIKKFQKSKGGGSYGRLDFTTQKWLNEELDKLRISVDKQYSKAVEVLNK